VQRYCLPDPAQPDGEPWQVAQSVSSELSAKILQRTPGDSWRVTSYSGLQQRGHGIAQDLIPRLDIDAAGVGEVIEESGLTPHQFPRGASPGTFLHSLFENLDFTQPVDPHWVEEQLALGGYDAHWTPVLTEWLDAILQAPLNETGVSLSQLSAREKQVEMEFYLPISQPLMASQLDALIRQYDPLSAGCPALDFMQVRGMLKALLTWYSAIRGAITCSITNRTGWVKTAPPIRSRRWPLPCRRIATTCSINFIPWRCIATCAIALLITIMNAILAALSISSCVALTVKIRSREFMRPDLTES
jgi:hypothetical protein